MYSLLFTSITMLYVYSVYRAPLKGTGHFGREVTSAVTAELDHGRSDSRPNRITAEWDHGRNDQTVNYRFIVL